MCWRWRAAKSTGSCDLRASCQPAAASALWSGASSFLVLQQLLQEPLTGLEEAFGEANRLGVLVGDRL